MMNIAEPTRPRLRAGSAGQGRLKAARKAGCLEGRDPARGNSDLRIVDQPTG
jgi:hypothetical protein